MIEYEHRKGEREQPRAINNPREKRNSLAERYSSKELAQRKTLKGIKPKGDISLR